MDCDLMRLALVEANKCTPKIGAFSVGCVIAEDGEPDKVLSSGYSRQFPGNTHAEECALKEMKLENITKLRHIHMYTTMEPCSVRTSGNKPCVERIVESGIVERVVIAVREPDDFVNCQGTEILVKAGIEVSYMPNFEEECLKVARRSSKQ